jgi:hypothetical protein
MDPYIINFLKNCRIQFDEEIHLDGHMIPRETFLSGEVYDTVKNDIEVLKKRYSSSSLTCLQKTAQKDQKWPLLNLVRQILRIHNFIMKPVRRSDGYTKEGKKKYKRFFLISKIKKIDEKIDEKIDL